MSPDEDALLNGIAADTAADLPRLVYADWLEEHGQDLRAEFIRVQCEIAKLEVGPRDVIDRNIHLWRRQQELIDGHRGELLAGVPFTPQAGQVPGPRFYRGFLDEISLTYDEIIKPLSAVYSIRPTPSEVSLLLESEYYILKSADEVVREFVTNIRFTGSVDYEESADHSYANEFWEEDYSWKRLHTLTSVNLGDDSDWLTVAFIRKDLPALKILRLHNHFIRDGFISWLLTHEVVQNLTHISLIENAIGDQAAIELADRLGNSANLKELDLRRNGITTVGQAALLARLGSKVILF